MFEGRPRKSQDECENDQRSQDEQQDLAQLQSTDFLLLQFFEKAETAEVDDLGFLTCEEMNQNGDGYCSQTKKNRRIEKRQHVF